MNDPACPLHAPSSPHAEDALLAVRDEITAPTGERVPSARWERDDTRLYLGDPRRPIAVAWPVDGSEHFWCAGGKDGLGDTERAAQLAAEDALIAVRDEIARAVGR